MASDVQLIVRVAGLPVTAVEPLASPLLMQCLTCESEILKHLQCRRSELVQEMEQVIPQTPPRLRRVLLTLKRDTYNGRNLSRSIRSTMKCHAEELHDLALPSFDRVLDLEESLAAVKTDFIEIYWRERQRQGSHLLSMLQNTAFRRGLALASPLMVKNLHSRAAHLGQAQSRREQKLEISLLRYVCRTALKTSPYSTLTRVGLAGVRDLDVVGVQLLGDSWRERSLLRLRRFILDQLRDLLLHHPPFRHSLRLVVNNSVEEIAPQRYSFLRPGYWDLDGADRVLRYASDALVTIDLAGALVNWIRSSLDRPLAFEHVLACARRELAERYDLTLVAEEMDELLQVGFLRYVLPWPSHEGHLERRLAEHLRKLPADPELTTIVAGLDNIVALESSFPVHEEPEVILEEIGRQIEAVWQAGIRLTELRSDIERKQARANELYEDVLLLPRLDQTTEPEMAHVAIDRVERVVATMAPLVGLAHLYNRRHDFLHAVGALMRSRWPGLQRVPFLALFREAQALWRDYRGFLRTSRRSPDGWRETFNPFALAEVADLRRLRDAIWTARDCWVQPEGDDDRIQLDHLAEWLTRVPDKYAPLVGPCLFLQPIGTTEEQWVLNRMWEGTGRFTSRFTPVMEDEVRARYVENLQARSVLIKGGEPAEILDLFCVQGDTLNVHAVQTRRVLELPGEDLHLPTTRRLGLNDLFVSLCPVTHLPRLEDIHSRCLIPVHLGGTGEVYVPVLLKFLWLFGPGEVLSVFPPRRTHRVGEVRNLGRLLAGDVVLMRRQWVVPSTALQEFASLPAPEAFAALNRWRVRHGLPDRVFLLEKVDGSLQAKLYKPQFVDFSSPLLVAMLCSILKSADEPLSFEEALPLPENLPRDGGGKRWGLELVLDTLALRPPYQRPAADSSFAAVMEGSSCQPGPCEAL